MKIVSYKVGELKCVFVRERGEMGGASRGA